MKIWLGFSLIVGLFAIVCGTWYWLLKADRLTTKSTTDATPAWSLYSTAWTALTAQKWNELVDKSKASYVKQAFTNGDITLASSRTYQDVWSITMTTWNSPVLLTAKWLFIESSTAGTLGCTYYIDGIDQWWKWWYYDESVGWSSALNMNILFITDTLTVWSHTFKLSCKSSNGWTLDKNSSNPLLMSAMELKQ